MDPADDDMFERNLPPYQANDLAAWKKGVAEKSRLLDCLWGELYGSINIAEINDGAITALFGGGGRGGVECRHSVHDLDP